MSGPWDAYKEPSTEGPWSAYSGFDAAIAPLLKREGGYVDDPADSGGETKFGISKKAFPNLDIASLTEEDARNIYRKEYWDKVGADQLPPEAQTLVFDAAVNHGVAWAKRTWEEVGGDPAAFWARRKEHYDRLAESRPKDKKFHRGWMNRLEEVTPPGPWQEYRGQ